MRAAVMRLPSHRIGGRVSAAPACLLEETVPFQGIRITVVAVVGAPGTERLVRFGCETVHTLSLSVGHLTLASNVLRSNLLE
jgi:hypothetical protein